MDRLDAMSILVAAVDEGSLTAAGRRRHVPLATVSRKVAELERSVGAHLLARSTRRLALTEAGVAYVAACRRILAEVDAAERAAAGEQAAPRGNLVVAAPLVFGRLHVVPVVSAFLALHPEINVRLLLSDRNADLVEDHIDAALRIGKLPDSSVIAAQIGTVRRVVCASPAFLARCGTPVAPRDLSALPCITFDVLGGPGAWTFAGPKGRRPVTVEVSSRLSVNTAEAAIDAAAAGVGITRVLSYQARDAVAAGSLRVVLRAFEPPPIPVSLLHAAVTPMPLKLRGFLDFAEPRLRACLAGPPGDKEAP